MFKIQQYSHNNYIKTTAQKQKIVIIQEQSLPDKSFKHFNRKLLLIILPFTDKSINWQMVSASLPAV